LDEPTAGMNPVERRQILELLNTLVKDEGITLLIVEHDMDIVFKLADHIIVLNHGSLLLEGTPQEIHNDPKVMEVYLGAALVEKTSEHKTHKNDVGEELLKLEEIDTFYGLSHVLHNVSLEVRKGETVALLGRNGVGKTTTLRTIMGINPPKRGAIKFKGENIGGLPPYNICGRGIGYTPDDRRIFPNLTAMQNLNLPTQVQKKRERHWTVEKVEVIFPPLKELRDRKGRFLSGGEQKMLSIGRALMVDPDLLILDEPSEGLSPLIIGLLLDALAKITEEGVTTLLADQNLNFAHNIADRAYILDKGAIAYTGTMDALWEDEETVKRYLSV
jgi:branched-chain amino acid transport system ATP-binding protein